MPDDYAFPLEALAKGDLERFGQLLSRYPERQPPNMEAILNGLGYYFLNRSEHEKAGQFFQQNISLFPESWNVYDSYAEFLLKTGKPAEARVYYRKALALNPGDQRIVKIVRGL